MNDDVYIGNRVWSKIQANGGEIANGIYSIRNNGNVPIYLSKSDVTPATQTTGVRSIMRGETFKYDLELDERLWLRGEADAVQVGVVTA